MKHTLLFFFLLIATIAISQDKAGEKIKIYNPEADAKSEIKSAIAEANDRGKHVFIQIGGNWCGWCIRFHNFIKEDKELDMLFRSSFVPVKVNYSQDVKNLEVLKELGFPQRFGFPVFVILDGEGNRIHTQDSGLLEFEKGYDKKKLVQFFRSWSKAALDEGNYK